MKYRIFLAITLLILLLFPLPAWAANPSQIIQLKAQRSCAFCDLKSAYLPVTNFDYHQLLGADLSGANLMGTSFVYSNLSRVNLTKANLNHTNFQHTKLILTDFTGAIFNETNLTEADLNGALVSEKQLAKAKLCKTTLPDGLISNRDC